jgi:glycosyltransferase involved in cell wall biosynthesis
MIPGLVSIVLPTRKRTDRAVACIKRLFETIHGHNVELILVIDDDQETLDAVRSLTSPIDLVLVWHEELQGHAKIWNHGLLQSKGEFVVLAADDLWWGDDWLTIALNEFVHFGDKIGLVGFNDQVWNGHTLATHYIAHRLFIIKFLGGVLTFPHYKYCCNDSEAHARAKQAQRYRWASSSIVRHDHYTTGRRGVDTNDERVRGLQSEDTALFYRRMQEGFPDNFDPVITE